MTQTITTRSPLIGRRDVNVFAFADLGGERHPVRFSKSVAWVAECEAGVVFLHGGRKLRTGSKYGDHSYGYLSCLDEAIEDGRESAKLYEVTQESSLVIECLAVIKLTAVLPDTGEDYLGGKRYECVPQGWFHDFDGIEEAIARFRKGEGDGAGFVTDIVHRDPLAGTVWSSVLTDVENAAALEAFKERAYEIVPGDGSGASSASAR